MDDARLHAGAGDRHRDELALAETRADGNSSLTSRWTCGSPRREGIDENLDLVEAGLRIEDVLGGAPGSRLQANLAQLLDIETAPLTARRQSGLAAASVLIDQDMSNAALGAQGMRAEDALHVVI